MSATEEKVREEMVLYWVGRAEPLECSSKACYFVEKGFHPLRAKEASADILPCLIAESLGFPIPGTFALFILFPST